MKSSEKLVKNYGLVAGVAAIAAAFLMIIFVFLAEIGCINPRKVPITMTTSNSSKMYDGKELVGQLLYPENKLIDGHSVEILSYTSIVDIGEVENDIAFVIKDETGADVTNRYNITYNKGTLKVKAKSISIRSKNASKVYDGKPLECPEFDIVSGSLMLGHQIAVRNYVQYTDVGKYSNDIVFIITDERGNDVTNCYDISFVKGQLEISAIMVKVRTASVTKIYDGVPASAPQWEFIGGTLEPGVKMSVAEVTEFDGVGTVDNIIRFNFTDSTGADVTSKYGVIYDYGQISVSPVNLSIEMGSLTTKYTGKSVRCDTYTITSGKLCEGHTLTVVGKKRVDVGVSYNDLLSYTVTATMPNGTKKDVSHCYSISYTSGTITVTSK